MAVGDCFIGCRLARTRTHEESRFGEIAGGSLIV